MQDPSGDKSIAVTGDLDSGWSVWRYQVLEETDPSDYENDFRFTPETDVKVWVYTRYTVTGDSSTFAEIYGGAKFVLLGAIAPISSLSVIASALILSLAVF